MRHKRSDYMRWAKTHQAARYNLATSGVAGFPMRDLPFDPARLEINGNNSYGFRPLQSAMAARHGIDPDCVVEAAGTSMANHLAMAAILEDGDEALIERPVYGPILDVALYLGADVKRFDRTEESGYAVDVDAVRRALTPRTRLIVITNLHNPSSAFTPEAVLREIGEMARDVGATVLVDEVYLDAVYENTPRTSFHLGPQFVVTSSLTKIYGVSGLRCGWILANPELADRMRRLNDIYGATPAHPAEILAVAAFENLPLLRDRARRMVEKDRAVLANFLAEHAGMVSAARTEWGTTCFLRLCHGDVEGFLESLRGEYDASAVPGRFFESPSCLRIGMGQDSEMFAEGLRRVAQCVTKGGSWRSEN
jgi:aspartate/methionine/tyrosine aminotransferase